MTDVTMLAETDIIGSHTVCRSVMLFFTSIIKPDWSRFSSMCVV